jgi:hypothetical protein
MESAYQILVGMLEPNRSLEKPKHSLILKLILNK